MIDLTPDFLQRIGSVLHPRFYGVTIGSVSFGVIVWRWKIERAPWRERWARRIYDAQVRFVVGTWRLVCGREVANGLERLLEEARRKVEAEKAAEDSGAERPKSTPAK